MADVCEKFCEKSICSISNGEVAMIRSIPSSVESISFIFRILSTFSSKVTFGFVFIGPKTSSNCVCGVGFSCIGWGVGGRVAIEVSFFEVSGAVTVGPCIIPVSLGDVAGVDVVEWGSIGFISSSTCIIVLPSFFGFVGSGSFISSVFGCSGSFMYGVSTDGVCALSIGGKGVGIGVVDSLWIVLVVMLVSNNFVSTKAEDNCVFCACLFYDFYVCTIHSSEGNCTV